MIDVCINSQMTQKYIALGGNDLGFAPNVCLIPINKIPYNLQQYIQMIKSGTNQKRHILHLYTDVDNDVCYSEDMSIIDSITRKAYDNIVDLYDVVISGLNTVLSNDASVMIIDYRSMCELYKRQLKTDEFFDLVLGLKRWDNTPINIIETVFIHTHSM